MKHITYLFLVFALAIAACEDPALPTLAAGDDALKTQLRGTWLPSQLQITYQVGAAPTQRDTTVTLTPTSTPLLVPNRANVIMPFTDTLYVGTVATARIDTFFTRNRGIRQQGNFFLTTGAEAGAALLRVGRPTYLRGAVSRWNYDFVLHGTVLPSTTNANVPAYTYTTYANYPLTIREVSSNRLVLGFQATGNINNLPQVPVTPANQLLNSTWAGRVAQFTATFVR